MSARICTDCSGPYLAAFGTDFLCETCGWIGTPNSGLERQGKELAAENSRRLELTRAGKLFTLRAEFVNDSTTEQESALKKILGTSRLAQSTKNGNRILRAEVNERPTKEMMGTIKKLERVKSVWVHP